MRFLRMSFVRILAVRILKRLRRKQRLVSESCVTTYRGSRNDKVDTLRESAVTTTRFLVFKEVEAEVEGMLAVE